MDDVRPPKHKSERAILEALEALGGDADRASITRKAAESDLFTAAECRTPAPPSKGQYPTYLSYALSWALTALKNQGLVENYSRGRWRLSG
ncbi:MAG: hypothetical protein H0U16_04465 [Actinobacteria bacterium]|nr:hypothetical protein [Actinomycetota bacterium]